MSIFKYNGNEKDHYAISLRQTSPQLGSHYSSGDVKGLTIHDKVTSFNPFLFGINTVETIYIDGEKKIGKRLFDSFSFYKSLPQIVFLKSTFLAGDYFLFEGASLIIDNFKDFEDKQNFIKRMKLKKNSTKDMLLKLVKTNKMNYVEFLFDNNIPTYEDAMKFIELNLSPEINTYIGVQLTKYSEKEKQLYNDTAIVKADLDLGMKEYSIVDLKEDFSCSVVDNKIVISKYNKSNDTIIFPKSVDGVCDYSFKQLNNNSTVKKIYFEEGIKNISVEPSSFYIFSKFSALSEIHLPKSMEFVDSKIFELLKNVTVVYEKEDSDYKVINDFFIYKNEIYNFTEKTQDVIIPDGITHIYRRYFEWSRIKSVKFPTSIQSIGEHAFHKCFHLEKVEFPEKLDGELEIDDFAFKYCEELESLSLPIDISRIAYKAFDKCKKLKKLSFPNEFNHLNSKFFSLFNLHTINLPAEFSFDESNPFSEIVQLREINVDEKNLNYRSIDGILYNKECTKIISIPSRYKGKLSIPDSVEKISENALPFDHKINDVSVLEKLK